MSLGRALVLILAVCFAAASTSTRADEPPDMGSALQLMRFWYGTIWAADYSGGGQLNLDLTCDGIPDRLFAWRDGVNPEGDYFHIALISNRRAPLPQGWEALDEGAAMLRPLRLNVGTGEQLALCHNRQKPYGSGYRTTVEPIPDDARQRFGLPRSCRQWLRVDDGMCDAMYIGYDPAKDEFVLDRN